VPRCCQRKDGKKSLAVLSLMDRNDEEVNKRSSVFNRPRPGSYRSIYRNEGNVSGLGYLLIWKWSCAAERKRNIIKEAKPDTLNALNEKTRVIHQNRTGDLLITNRGMIETPTKKTQAFAMIWAA
jgi:hypothetical protein